MFVTCAYCGWPADKVTGREQYPHRPDLYEKIIYRCEPCKASVGTHPGTDRPLGRLANRALKQAKMAAHEAFDPLWRNGSMKRSEAYKWLAAELAITAEECHIGMFDEDMCAAVIAAVQRRAHA